MACCGRGLLLLLACVGLLVAWRSLRLLLAWRSLRVGVRKSWGLLVSWRSLRLLVVWGMVMVYVECGLVGWSTRVGAAWGVARA